MDLILTTEQLAEELGDIPPNTIHYWRAQGTGPKGIKVGKRVLYKWSDVEAWLDKKAAEDPMADRPQHRGQTRVDQKAAAPIADRPRRRGRQAR